MQTFHSVTTHTISYFALLLMLSCMTHSNAVAQTAIRVELNDLELDRLQSLLSDDLLILHLSQAILKADQPINEAEVGNQISSKNPDYPSLLKKEAESILEKTEQIGKFNEYTTKNIGERFGSKMDIDDKDNYYKWAKARLLSRYGIAIASVHLKSGMNESFNQALEDNAIFFSFSVPGKTEEPFKAYLMDRNDHEFIHVTEMMNMLRKKLLVSHPEVRDPNVFASSYEVLEKSLYEIEDDNSKNDSGKNDPIPFSNENVQSTAKAKVRATGNQETRNNIRYNQFRFDAASYQWLARWRAGEYQNKNGKIEPNWTYGNQDAAYNWQQTSYHQMFIVSRAYHNFDKAILSFNSDAHEQQLDEIVNGFFAEDYKRFGLSRSSSKVNRASIFKEYKRFQSLFPSSPYKNVYTVIQDLKKMSDSPEFSKADLELRILETRKKKENDYFILRAEEYFKRDTSVKSSIISIEQTFFKQFPKQFPDTLCQEFGFTAADLAMFHENQAQQKASK